MATVTNMVEGDTLEDLQISGIDPPIPNGDSVTIAIKRASDGTRIDLGPAVIVSPTEVRRAWALDGSDTPGAGSWAVEYTVIDPEGVQTGPTSGALTLNVRAKATAP